MRERLGTGGMASVWLAEDTKLGRVVAIKMMSEALTSDPRSRERFEQEARIAAGLSHPNLVQVYDVGFEQEQPFLVMEYVAGGTLEERRKMKGAPRLDLEALARELLDAIAHIHGAGIIHRDVKPANVLVGADDRVRLTDFGIARSEGANRLTQTGQVIGTLKFLAPEIARGEPATPQSDLYSLGVTLSGLSEDGGSQEIRALVGHLTAADPALRPAGAEAAFDLLDDEDPTALLAPEASEAPQTEPTAKLAPASPETVTEAADRGAFRVSRRWVLAVAAALALVALVVVLSGGGDDGVVAGIERAPAARAPLDRQLDFLDRAVRQVTPR